MKKANQAIPNDKLKQERLARAWSQWDVADAIGTTAHNVSRWERGITFPRAYQRQELCKLFAKSPEELGFLTVGESDSGEKQSEGEDLAVSSSLYVLPLPEDAESILLLAENMERLALLYSAQEKYEQAEQLALQALEIYQKHWDQKHRTIAKNLSIRAEILYQQRKYPQAESLLKRVLALLKEELGADYLDILP